MTDGSRRFETPDISRRRGSESDFCQAALQALARPGRVPQPRTAAGHREPFLCPFPRGRARLACPPLAGLVSAGPPGDACALHRGLGADRSLRPRTKQVHGDPGLLTMQPDGHRRNSMDDVKTLPGESLVRGDKQGGADGSPGASLPIGPALACFCPLRSRRPPSGVAAPTRP